MKCGEKCEIYSRVTGYYRPVANWNKGKKEEFGERKSFRIAGAVSALAAAILLPGCGAAQTLAQGVSEKSLSGSGTVAIQRVGIDDETKTPVLKSTVVTGDYASARNGDSAFQYRRKKSPSIFNTSAVTEEVTINCIGTKEEVAAARELAERDAANAPAPESAKKTE